MASVVFMRGVNVGGHRPFRPAALAKELSAFEVINIGAAGTYVVSKSVGHAKLRAELLRRLPFEAELMICRASDLMDLAAAELFSASAKDVRRFVSVLAKRPKVTPTFPIERPSGKPWQVKVVGLQGKFALSLWRRAGRTMLYPNEVVEKELVVPATTRSWNTIARINRVLHER